MLGVLAHSVIIAQTHSFWKKPGVQSNQNYGQGMFTFANAKCKCIHATVLGIATGPNKNLAHLNCLRVQEAARPLCLKQT